TSMAAAHKAPTVAAALALVVNAFVWGVSWWPFRQLQAHGLHPLWATAGVYLVSLTLLLAARPRALHGVASSAPLLVLLVAAGLRACPSTPRIGVMFAGGAIAASVTALVAGVGAPVAPPPQAWGVAVALSLGFLAANAALQYGASRLPAQTTSLVMLSEVVFASVTSVLAGASEPTASIWAGGAMVLGAAAWAALAQPRKPGGSGAQSSA